ncbi:hypothetical protein QBC34DRAFT_407212 [Podospora aff. communis PSN243]|uniref:Protein HRI1 n=1 Tax=Podospora aff. communis PSN243 TaxID=3040156 RepID=A0AAV9GJC9_9PEZI|nr:hypothetical protein QBC34DRAFT_407212 [Podospora aff. communis PSN243]
MTEMCRIMADISVRNHIRWLPDEASEPTSTIVLTSPERRFVDLRVRVDAKPSYDGKLPLTAIDWAIAGTSTSETTEGSDVSHARWNHWIDSRTANTENLADEGDNYPQPDGSILEKGRMVNPATGEPADYEELWVSEDIRSVPALTSGGDIADVSVCVVLEMDEDGRRGMVVRLGQYCQGFMRTGDGEADITIERLKWDSATGGWSKEVRTGDAELPTDFATHLAHEAVKGDVVRVSAGGDAWTVVERAEV